MSTELPSSSRPPAKPLPKKYLPAILYLADRMSAIDKDVVSKERSLIFQLAEFANMSDFRSKREFMDMDEEKACTILDIEVARHAALVVMALILKADGLRKPEEHNYFRKIREKLGAASVSVPVELEAHKTYAARFFG